MREINIVTDDLQPAPVAPALVEDAALQLEREFVQIVREEIGMTEQLASGFAQALVAGLRRRMGGSELWIPAPSRSDRDAAIRRDFDGTNLSEVMRRYGVGRSTVYRAAGRRPPPDESKNPRSPLVLGRVTG